MRRNPDSLRQRYIASSLERKRRQAQMLNGAELSLEETAKWPRAGERIIFKIQVPLETNDPVPKALMYDKQKQFQTQVEVTPQLLHIMRGDYKAFFSCRMRPDPSKPHAYKIEIGARILDRNW